MKKSIKTALLLVSLTTPAWGHSGNQSGGSSDPGQPDPMPIPVPFPNNDTLAQAWGSMLLSGVSDWHTWKNAYFYNNCHSTPGDSNSGKVPAPFPRKSTSTSTDSPDTPDTPENPDTPDTNYRCFDFSVVTEWSTVSCPDGSIGTVESGIGVTYNYPGDPVFYGWGTSSVCQGTGGGPTDPNDGSVGSDDQTKPNRQIRFMK